MNSFDVEKYINFSKILPKFWPSITAQDRYYIDGGTSIGCFVYKTNFTIDFQESSPSLDVRVCQFVKGGIVEISSSQKIKRSEYYD